MADTFTASGYLFLFHYINTLTIWLVNCCCIPRLFLFWKSETAKQNQKWFTFEMLHCKHDLIETQPTCVWQLRETTGGAKFLFNENRKCSNCKQHRAWLISFFFLLLWMSDDHMREPMFLIRTLLSFEIQLIIILSSWGQGNCYLVRCHRAGRQTSAWGGHR